MDVEINATRIQIEDLIESVLWADIVRELDQWSEGFAIEQDGMVDEATENNSSTATVLLRLGDLNGRKKAVKYMQGILEVFLSILEDKKDDNGRDSTN